MKDNAATRFSMRMLVGCILSIVIGLRIDAFFHTSPWIMLGMLAYAIIGSFYLLLKETKENE